MKGETTEEKNWKKVENAGKKGEREKGKKGEKAVHFYRSSQ